MWPYYRKQSKLCSVCGKPLTSRLATKHRVCAKRPPNVCLDCGKPIVKEALRCKSCNMVKRGSEGKDPMPLCIECGETVEVHHHKRCRLCRILSVFPGPVSLGSVSKLHSQRKRRGQIQRTRTGPIDRKAIKLRDRMVCSICHKPIDERVNYPHPDSLSFDHSWPLSLGGPHTQENQRVAHLHCNLKRSIGYLPVQMVLC